MGLQLQGDQTGCRKWNGEKLSSRQAEPGRQISCWLVSLHFLCYILSSRPVEGCLTVLGYSNREGRYRVEEARNGGGTCAARDITPSKRHWQLPSFLPFSGEKNSEKIWRTDVGIHTSEIHPRSDRPRKPRLGTEIALWGCVNVAETVYWITNPLVHEPQE